MNWKELQIDNLPHDILTGDYEFQTYIVSVGLRNPEWCNFPRTSKLAVINDLYKNDSKYRYRKPEPKAPSHEEIMTKWWDCQDRGWLKVLYYLDGFYYTADPHDNDFIAWSKEGFTGRESADIPPE